MTFRKNMTVLIDPYKNQFIILSRVNILNRLFRQKSWADFFLFLEVFEIIIKNFENTIESCHNFFHKSCSTVQAVIRILDQVRVMELDV